MKVKVVGTALMVTSAIKKDMVEQAKHFCPDALKVVDGETGDTLFKVDRAEEASIGKFGVLFNGVSGEGNLTATVVIPDVEDKAAYVKENYGLALANLAESEEIITDSIAATMDTINGAFEDMVVE